MKYADMFGSFKQFSFFFFLTYGSFKMFEIGWMCHLGTKHRCHLHKAHGWGCLIAIKLSSRHHFYHYKCHHFYHYNLQVWSVISLREHLNKIISTNVHIKFLSTLVSELDPKLLDLEQCLVNRVQCWLAWDCGLGTRVKWVVDVPLKCKSAWLST